MPGIATATGTMMDSAAKHTLACRVDENRMHSFADRQNIMQNKHKYCVNRHELVLNTCNEWRTGVVSQAAAYPHIVSNLGDVRPDIKKVLNAIYMTLQTPLDMQTCRNALKTLSQGGDDQTVKEQINTIPFFHAQGYSLGVAYANHCQGDIVCAVQVGGMLTVRNGHFACQTGDMIQWYFDFEQDMFQDHDAESMREGERKYAEAVNVAQNHVELARGVRAHQNAYAVLNDVVTRFRPAPSTTAANSTVKRKRHVDMGLGMVGAKANIPYPKPYIPSTTRGEHYGDRIRVFAKCVNGGRAHDMIDIMLMTQSL